MTTAGHNSVASDELRLLIERIEWLAEEKKAIADDIKDVFGEAKACGFDVRAMRSVIALRKLEAEVREERRTMESLYLSALGLE